MLSRAQNTFRHNPRLRRPVSSIYKDYINQPFTHTYLPNQLLNFNKTCKDILLGGGY